MTKQKGQPASGEKTLTGSDSESELKDAISQAMQLADWGKGPQLPANWENDLCKLVPQSVKDREKFVNQIATVAAGLRSCYSRRSLTRSDNRTRALFEKRRDAAESLNALANGARTLADKLRRVRLGPDTRRALSDAAAKSMDGPDEPRERWRMLLGDPPPGWSISGDTLLDVVRDVLGDVASWAENASAEVRPPERKGGPTPNLAVYEAVDSLIDIWREHTKRRPGAGAPFLNLARHALEWAVERTPDERPILDVWEMARQRVLRHPRR